MFWYADIDQKSESNNDYDKEKTSMVQHMTTHTEVQPKQPVTNPYCVGLWQIHSRPNCQLNKCTLNCPYCESKQIMHCIQDNKVSGNVGFPVSHGCCQTLEKSICLKASLYLQAIVKQM